MAQNDTKDITAIFRERTPIKRALEEAHVKAIKQHIQADLPMPVWRDGQTVFLSPEELKILLQSKPSNP